MLYLASFLFYIILFLLFCSFTALPGSRLSEIFGMAPKWFHLFVAYLGTGNSYSFLGRAR